nr:hypothetical protein [Tanacetum cinerariifolium]
MDGWKPRALKNKSFAEIKELFDKEMTRINNFVDFRTQLVEESSKKVEESTSKRARDKLEQESAKKQKVDDDQEAAKLKRCLEIVLKYEDDVNIMLHYCPLSLQPLLITRSTKKGEKTMFKHNVEDNIWKNQQGLVKVVSWKLFNSCGVYCVTMQNIVYYLLFKKMYPLTRNTLHQMWNDVRLQVDYEVEMAYDLLRLVKRKLRKGYVPE